MNLKKFLFRKLPFNGNAVYVLGIIIIILMVDMSLLPKDQVSAKVILFSIKLYKKNISPGLSTFVKCKFTPTCSQYGYKSVEWYGTFWGGLKTINRLWRCSPWTKDHGWDPP